jgi:hypothetical protein
VDHQRRHVEFGHYAVSPGRSMILRLR